MAILNLDKSHGLDDRFYVVCQNKRDDFWHVRLKDTHFVIVATVGYQGALDCLYKIVQRYKTWGRLQKALENINYPIHSQELAKAEKALRESIEYKEDVEETVKRAMFDYNNRNNIENKPKPKPLKALNKKPMIENKPIDNTETIESPIREVKLPLVPRKPLKKLSLKK